MKIRMRMEFKIQDCWVGVFWKRGRNEWIQDEDQSDNTIWRARVSERMDIWVCVVPCVPLHILVLWGERLMTEDETLANMVEL